jgi:hypothetical protein
LSGAYWFWAVKVTAASRHINPVLTRKGNGCLIFSSAFRRFFLRDDPRERSSLKIGLSG